MKQVRHRSSRWPLLFLVAVSAVLASFSTPASAQLFGGDGLFNRKKDKIKPGRLGTAPETGIPTPVTGRAEAVKGSEIAFYIKAETKAPGVQVEFLIRAFPSAGKIVSVISDPADRSRAIVTYYAEPGSSATSDAFSFAVRYRNGRYSPAMRYDIDLEDGGGGGEIEVTPEMDFGKVMIGDEVIREISARNNRGEPFARQLMVASPWHILEPADGKVILPPRGSRNIKIAFRPTLAGEVNFLLGLSRSTNGLCKLKGEATLPFTLLTEELELVLDPKTRRRSGEAVFRNHSKKPILLQVRGSARLAKSLGEEVILMPDAETKKTIYLTKTDVAGFDGAAEFFLENGFSSTVRVSSNPVAGEIELEVPGAMNSEVINFGPVQAGRSTERGFLVKNIGGEPVPLSFEVGNPFRMIANPLEELAPLSSVQVAVEFAPLPGDEGLADVTMKVMTNDQVAAIRLLGNVTKGVKSARFSLSSGKGKVANPTAPVTPQVASAVQTPAVPPAADPNSGSDPLIGSPTGNPPVSGLAPIRIREPVGRQKTADGRLIDQRALDPPWLDPDVSPEEAEQMRSVAGLPTRGLILREFDPNVRGAEDLEMKSSGARSVVLGFTAPPDSDLHTFELETVGSIIPDEAGQVPVPVWLPFKNVEFEKIDRLVKANVEVPYASSEYLFRIITTDGKGRVAPPSNEISAWTKPPLDWTNFYTGIGVLLVIGFGFLVRKVILDRRAVEY